jgi:hypothetical protein
MLKRMEKIIDDKNASTNLLAQNVKKITKETAKE